VTIDGSEANAAAIRSHNDEHDTAIAIRQVKYLNNIIEQDHRALKRITCPMLGFKSFEAVQCTLAGAKLMHMPNNSMPWLHNRPSGRVDSPPIGSVKICDRARESIMQ
jgi:transposase-like protein